MNSKFKQSKLPREKELDSALDKAFGEDPAFVTWFLEKTKFKGSNGTYVSSRSNNPWCRVTVRVLNENTGQVENIKREGETDVFVVFERPDKTRFALHIENKTRCRKFTYLQPEVYTERARLWKSDPNYGSYDDWECVLIAPLAFYEKNKSNADKFDQYVQLEEVAKHLPLFDSIDYV